MRLFLITVLAAGLTAYGGEPAQRAPRPNPGFEKLKTLVGKWTGKSADGVEMNLSYRLVGNGSALEETMSHGDMVTMYYPDGDHLVLTHYCAAGNQPRMRAQGFKQGDNQLAFKFLDATNLPDKKAMHMHDLMINFKDADHFQEEWTHYNGGKPTGKAVIDYERVK